MLTEPAMTIPILLPPVILVLIATGGASLLLGLVVVSLLLHGVHAGEDSREGVLGGGHALGPGGGSPGV